jgi:hypothetical protein
MILKEYLKEFLHLPKINSKGGFMTDNEKIVFLLDFINKNIDEKNMVNAEKATELLRIILTGGTNETI